MRAGAIGRGGWERDREPVDDPTLLDESEPEGGRRGREGREGQRERKEGRKEGEGGRRRS